MTILETERLLLLSKLREFIRDVTEGRIGAVRHIHASARAMLAEQGTHITDLLFAFQGDRPPLSVFGSVSGAGRLDDTHAAPEMAQATLVLADADGPLPATRATLECGTNAPQALGAPSSLYMHKRIAIHGTRGFVEWQMNAWERFTPEGGHEQGVYQYAEEDLLGQAALTDAACNWLADATAVHPNNLTTSLAEVNVLLALYESALHRAPVALPFTPEENYLPRLRAALRED